MGGRIVKSINVIINTSVLIIIMLLSAFAVYALWDSNQLYDSADKANYSIYKPSAADEGKSFKELQSINPEVIAWLSVYGTNIDYPVTQGQDNMKYINTNAEGEYSLSGSIFLDSGNNSSFTDFNSIVYGHHMEKKTMFGEIGAFADKEVFDSHPYGNLYVDGQDYGLEFFAFVHADAYDSTVYTVNVSEENRQDYLNGLLAKAVNKRDIDVTTDDRIIMLSTCSSSSTNGRDILVGRITDKTYEDRFENK
jgi:sortase B